LTTLPLVLPALHVTPVAGAAGRQHDAYAGDRHRNGTLCYCFGVLCCSITRIRPAFSNLEAIAAG
jgi:hypothetical protein